jgi:broad specificity phosphatase PhoE
MNKIYLTRHGQDEDNALGILNGHRDKPLTEIGIRQAHNLAEIIKNDNIVIDKIYSSPLIRTKQTAEIVAKTNNLEMEEMPLLIERDFGVMSGQYVKDIEKLCSPDIIKTEKIIYFLNAPQSENFINLLLRAEKILKQINETHQNQNILLVTHGDIGKMIYAAYYNLNWQNVLRQFHFGNTELLLLSPNSKAKNSHISKATQHNS